ncbi:MAG: hypothetical protein V3R87_06225 [Dehalococcoidia bacterium]
MAMLRVVGAVTLAVMDLVPPETILRHHPATIRLHFYDMAEKRKIRPLY